MEKKLRFALTKYNEALTAFSTFCNDTKVEDNDQTDILFNKLCSKLDGAKTLAAKLIIEITGVNDIQWAMDRVNYIRDFGSTYDWFLFKYNVNKETEVEPVETELEIINADSINLEDYITPDIEEVEIIKAVTTEVSKEITTDTEEEMLILGYFNKGSLNKDQFLRLWNKYINIDLSEVVDKIPNNTIFIAHGVNIDGILYPFSMADRNDIVKLNNLLVQKILTTN